MFLTILSFISDEFDDLEGNSVVFAWQILVLVSCSVSILIRLNIQNQIRDKYISKRAAIAENYHHL